MSTHTYKHTYTPLLTNAHCHTFTHLFTLIIHMSPYTQPHLIPTFTLTYVDTINTTYTYAHTLMSSFSNTHIAYQVHTCSYIQKIIPIHTAKGLPIEAWYKPTFPQTFPLALPSSILSHFQSSCSGDLATNIQTHSNDSVTSQNSDLGRNHPDHGSTCRIHKHTQHTALPVPNPLQGVNDRPSSRSEINLKSQVKKGDRL